jgi:uncharacterized membrane protein YccC
MPPPVGEGSRCQTAVMGQVASAGWRTRLAEARTWLSGIDPGLTRLRLAGVAVASMILAVGITSVISGFTGAPITVVLISAVLAMISNLAVNEPTIPRLRGTTALMVPVAVVAVAAGTLLAPYRLVADVVFVGVMIGAVLLRHIGPRGTALGMAGVMGFFFTQFLQAGISTLPMLLLAATIGVLCTLLLRGFVVVERTRPTLERMMRAFRAHIHGLVGSTAMVLSVDPDDTTELEHQIRVSVARQARLNQTALMLAEQLDRYQDEQEDAAAGLQLELRLFDSELAAERLAVTTRRLVREPVTDDVRRALRAGMRALSAATSTGSPPGRTSMLLETARTSVGPLVAETDGLGDRAQRVAFAVYRLADAVDPEVRTRRPAPAQLDLPDHAEDPPPSPTPSPEPAQAGPSLITRQAVQVGVATSLAIVGGELVSPQRWYWAVLTAFVVFTGTSSRGDVLTRGFGRLVATVLGVAAGMALAVLVTGHTVVALVLLFVCVFFALYLVRLSPALMVFWITAVLALLYGIIGQFSVETLLLRIIETGVGAAAGMLAGYLVLPVRTRAAFGTALDDVADAVDAVLAAAEDRVLGRAAPATLDVTRDMDTALQTLRARMRPLDSPLPWRRGRTNSSYHRAVRVFAGVDHFTRRLARVADLVTEPEWAATLSPAVERVRSNVRGLRVALLNDGRGADVESAEELVDAAEARAARTDDAARRRSLLTIARLLRRTDQVVVGFARDIGAAQADKDPTPTSTRTP